MEQLSDFKIVKEDNIIKIFVDGQEIKDVVSFSLEAKSPTNVTLNLTLDVSLL